jgi:2-haloacid dehalogenase
MAGPEIDALVFDVFGTLVDWRGSIARAAEAVGRAHAVEADWQAFTHAWHSEGYQGGMARVRSGELPWTSVAELHRRGLEELLPRFGLSGISSADVAQLAGVWRRLDPWPDVVEGLQRLKARYTIGPLSNGDFDMLVDLARHARLPWDAVFAAELFGAYKPKPEPYQGVARLLRRPPERIMLVASHTFDLRAGQGQGLRTAYIRRPDEYGPDHPVEPLDPSIDLVVNDLHELADQLGVQ